MIVASQRERRTAKHSPALDLRKLLRSAKFLAWKPRSRIIHFKYVDHRDGAHAHAIERHYTPAELAKAWGVDSETIRNLFRHEPGVVKIGDKNPKHKRSYLTLRIPAEVAERVHRRLSE